MGADHELGQLHHEDETPRHLVTLPAFYMGTTAITEQDVPHSKALDYHRVYNLPARITSAHAIKLAQVLTIDYPLYSFHSNKHIGGEFRLPSEEQWEYACRGTGNGYMQYYLGNDFNTAVLKFVPPDGINGPRPAKSGIPNQNGLYQLLGNMWEWTTSPYTRRYDMAPDERTYPVVRGGTISEGTPSANSYRCRTGFRGIEGLTLPNSIGVRLIVTT